MYLIEVTSQPLETAYLHILEPRKPLPPQTIIFFAAVLEAILGLCVCVCEVGESLVGTGRLN